MSSICLSNFFSKKGEKKERKMKRGKIRKRAKRGKKAKGKAQSQDGKRHGTLEILFYMQQNV